MGLVAFFQTVVALIAPAPPPPDLPPLTAREKAALVVVSGMPAPRGVAGVVLHASDQDAPRPSGALVFVDQEGGGASTFDTLPPGRPASTFRSAREAFRAGRATGRSLRAADIGVDLAPVLDLAGGPLGSRHFRRPEYGIAFARGLGAGGAAACVKHFPGLGTARISTDNSPHVRARLDRQELGAFRQAVRARAACVMVGHAFYGRFGARRASFSRRA